MGGLVEDYIIIALKGHKLTTHQILGRLEQGNEGRKYGTISRHLTKMYHLQQLCRERGADGQYVYWNPCNEGDTAPFEPRELHTKKVIIMLAR